MVVLVGMFIGNIRVYVILKINLFSESILSFLGIERNLEDYNIVINKFVMDNGVIVKLNEVVLDNNELFIFINISLDRILKDYEIWYGEMILYINNKKVKFIVESGGSKNIDNYII